MERRRIAVRRRAERGVIATYILELSERRGRGQAKRSARPRAELVPASQ